MHTGTYIYTYIYMIICVYIDINSNVICIHMCMHPTEVHVLIVISSAFRPVAQLSPLDLQKKVPGLVPLRRR